jgi:hypothetical protein
LGHAVGAERRVTGAAGCRTHLDKVEQEHGCTLPWQALGGEAPS